MIELRAYKPEDYLDIQRRHFDNLTFLNLPNKNAIAKNLMNGPAYTLFNGQPIACGGIILLWKGVGEGWAITSPSVERHQIVFARTIWKYLESIIKEHKLERVQTIVDAEHKMSQKWVERMGFHKEGLMSKYIGGRDFYRYALIRS